MRNPLETLALHPLPMPRYSLRERNRYLHVPLRLIAIILMVLPAGCSEKSTLTRSKAKDIIWTTYGFGKGAHLVINDLNREEAQAGIDLGMWKVDNRTLTLTPQGEKFFTATRQKASPYILIPNIITLTIKQEVHPALEITGITDEPDANGTRKRVEYTLQWYAEIPEELRGLFKQRVETRAKMHVVMALYDDGWRIVTKPTP